MGESAGSISDVLLIRHLPATLSAEDQVELLKHFGAVEVKCLGNKGPLKYSAFARFNDVKSAESALKRLHQFNVLGHTIAAEYSKKTFKDVKGEVITNKTKKDDLQKPEETYSPDKLKIQENIDGIFQHWSLRYPFNPKLCYVYPPPTPGILANITNALIAVPKFYVQVLHLMNKMNLPAPFGIVTPAPPLPQEHPVEDVGIPPQEPLDEVETVEMEVESTEESELETDSEAESQVTKKTATLLPKRKKNLKQLRAKKPRLLASNIMTVSKTQSVPSLKPTEVFEQPTAVASKKIEIKYGQDMFETQDTPDTLPHAERTNSIERDEPEVHLSVGEQDTKEAVTVVEGGFGKLEPVVAKDGDEDEDSSGEEGEWGSGEFISSKLLRRGRLTSREMRDLNVFKKYESGEPTTRLYIKNLAKQTVEKDLHYIFGRYVNWESETEKNMFDIRLMKEGRMKGQCFVTLASEKKAKHAREDTNGYQLNGKPMVVQFARSAKPKDNK